MSKFLDSNGLLYFWQKIKALIPSTGTAAQSTTGISVADHGTGSVYSITGVGSGSFTQGSFSGGSGSFTDDVTGGVLSFTHTHTAATHGTDSHTHTAPTRSSVTVVTGKAHSVTDNGHTHAVTL